MTKTVKGKREDDIHDAHHERVHFAAEKTGDRAVKNADRQRHGRRAQADRNGNLAAVKNPDQEIAAERVGAEPVICIRRDCAEPQILRLV